MGESISRKKTDPHGSWDGKGPVPDGYGQAISREELSGCGNVRQCSAAGAAEKAGRRAGQSAVSLCGCQTFAGYF